MPDTVNQGDINAIVWKASDTFGGGCQSERI